ncbi:helix-turn-helix domain-containing protein [Candidatus Poribacteria bacterium]
MSKITIDGIKEIGYHSDRLEGDAGPERLLTVPEVCEILRITRNSLYSLTHRKRIPFIKMQRRLRFRRSAIERWLAEMEVCDVGTET